MGRNRKLLLSIIVPAYKQEKTIKKDLERMISAFNEGLSEALDFEVILVVDGKVDKTEQEAKKVKDGRIRIISYEQNQGKGYAVRTGMESARGELVSFLDAGMDISPKSLLMLMAHLTWYEADIIVGSKRHPVSRVNYPFKRKILSLGYHFLVKIFFGLSLSDTQSGIKIFRREVVEKIIDKLLVKRYAMDIEMLAVARHFGFKRIYEAPIEVTFNKSTSAINWHTTYKMLWDTLAVFYRLKILRYYDKAR